MTFEEIDGGPLQVGDAFAQAEGGQRFGNLLLRGLRQRTEVGKAPCDGFEEAGHHVPAGPYKEEFGQEDAIRRRIPAPGEGVVGLPRSGQQGGGPSNLPLRRGKAHGVLVYRLLSSRISRRISSSTAEAISVRAKVAASWASTTTVGTNGARPSSRAPPAGAGRA